MPRRPERSIEYGNFGHGNLRNCMPHQHQATWYLKVPSTLEGQIRWTTSTVGGQSGTAIHPILQIIQIIQYRHKRPSSPTTGLLIGGTTLLNYFGTALPDASCFFYLTLLPIQSDRQSHRDKTLSSRVLLKKKLRF